VWPQRVAAAAVLLFALGLGAFAIERQAGVDWPQTLAAMQRSWDRALQHLQSAAEPPAAPAALPPGAAPIAESNQVSPAAAPAPRQRPLRGAAAVAVPAADGDGDSSAAGAGTLQVGFANASYEVAGGEPAARIVVRRLGNLTRDVSFAWWTVGASARPDIDYATLGRRVETIPAGSDKLTVYVPIISNPQRLQPSQFYVAIAAAGAVSSEAASARATVTIEPLQEQ